MHQSMNIIISITLHTYGIITFSFTSPRLGALIFECTDVSFRQPPCMNYIRKYNYDDIKDLLLLTS